LVLFYYFCFSVLRIRFLDGKKVIIPFSILCNVLIFCLLMLLTYSQQFLYIIFWIVFLNFHWFLDEMLFLYIIQPLTYRINFLSIIYYSITIIDYLLQIDFRFYLPFQVVYLFSFKLLINISCFHLICIVFLKFPNLLSFILLPPFIKWVLSAFCF